MRMILILASLLIVALLAYRQLDLGSPGADNGKASEMIGGNAGTQLPKVPVKPQDVQAFGKQINAYVENAEAKHAKQIEQQLK